MAIHDLIIHLLEAHRLMTLGRMVPQILHKQQNLFGPLIGYCDIALHQLDPDHPAREDIERVRGVAKQAAAHAAAIIETAQRLEAERDELQQRIVAEQHADLHHDEQRQAA